MNKKNGKLFEKGFEKMETLYSNIGGKLRVVAKVCGVIGILCMAAGLLVELVTFFDWFNGLFLLACLITGGACLISSWPLYAFGQLVDDVHAIRRGANSEEAEFGRLPSL